MLFLAKIKHNKYDYLLKYVPIAVGVLVTYTAYQSQQQKLCAYLFAETKSNQEQCLVASANHPLIKILLLILIVWTIHVLFRLCLQLVLKFPAQRAKQLADQVALSLYIISFIIVLIYPDLLFIS